MTRLSPLGGVQELLPDLARVRLGIVNAYFLGAPGEPWVLVDAGLPRTFGPNLGGGKLLSLARARYGRPPQAIVLTHGHFDHVGGLRELLGEWQVPVYAHPLELPYLTGRSAYPPPDPTVSSGGMALSSPLFPPGPFDFSSHVRPLAAGGGLPDLPGWRWLFTPGHSPGHVSLWREGDATLIAGDAFVTTAQESALSAITEFPNEVRRPPAYYTPNWDDARESVRALAALNPTLAATGHGAPMWGELMREELRLLARDFDSIARPKRGRYVREGATADLSGVRRLPPTPPDSAPTPLGMGVAAGALALGLALLARRG